VRRAPCAESTLHLSAAAAGDDLQRLGLAFPLERGQVVERLAQAFVPGVAERAVVGVILAQQQMAAAVEAVGRVEQQFDRRADGQIGADGRIN